MPYGNYLRFTKPIHRKLTAEQASAELGFPCKRDLLITISAHGIHLKGSRLGEDKATFVPWCDVVSKSWSGLGLQQFRKDLA